MKKHIDDNVLIRSGNICKYVVLLTFIYLFLDLLINLHKIVSPFNLINLANYGIEFILLIIFLCYLLFQYAKQGIILGIKKKSLNNYPLEKVLLITISFSIVLSSIIWILVPYIKSLFIKLEESFFNFQNLKEYLIGFGITLIFLIVLLNISYLIAYLIYSSNERNDEYNKELEYSKMYKKLYNFLLILILINFTRRFLENYLLDIIYTGEEAEIPKIFGKAFIVLIANFIITFFIHAYNGMLLGFLDLKITKYPIKRILKNSSLYSIIVGLVPVVIPFLIIGIIQCIQQQNFEQLFSSFGLNLIYILFIYFTIPIIIVIFLFLIIVYSLGYLLIKIKGGIL